VRWPSRLAAQLAIGIIARVRSGLQSRPLRRLLAWESAVHLKNGAAPVTVGLSDL